MSSPRFTRERPLSEPPGTFRSLREAWMALVGLSAVFLFEMMSNTVLNVALPTIGRELKAPTIALQWVTNGYAVVFGSLMLVFGAVADRLGRRRVMLAGLVLLGVASLAAVAVSTTGELIAVRAVMGLAAAMTTPGTMALAFRLFEEEGLRVRAITLVSTVGMVGLAIGPTMGGLVLSFAPWQVLLLMNVPIVALAIVGIRIGVPSDDPADLHRAPADLTGGALGTATIVLTLVAPTLFEEAGAGSWAPWAAVAGVVVAATLFVVRERSARHPLLDLELVARPKVSGGLAYKAAAGLANAGLAYLVTLQLQLDWGWPPALASLGMLPQVIVLIAGGPFVHRFVGRVGIDRAAWMSVGSIVAGLAVYTLFGNLGYPGVVVALVFVAAGMRVVGAAAGVNVLNGLPRDRTSTGAALIDTAAEVTAAVGVAVVGTVLAALFAGDVATGHWSRAQAGQFREAVTVSGTVLTLVSAALAVWAMRRTRPAAGDHQDALPVETPASGS
ncbi:MFS transporter [Streptomyces kunmingensis]|uniref:MFS transporter n=1 Tax=Streptomyces kunmingensis TaxID=68225 RepID=A0ABU6CLY5_9ACTN|nr:MFS transporter [Streptomyces kunmingensis]MEB3965743.1 MFS transporter [Streptomyces kunmingensis]